MNPTTGPTGGPPPVDPTATKTQTQIAQEKQQDVVRKGVQADTVQEIDKNQLEGQAMQAVNTKAKELSAANQPATAAPAQAAMTEEQAAALATSPPATALSKTPTEVDIPQTSGQLTKQTLQDLSPTIKDSLTQLQTLISMFASSGKPELQQLADKLSKQVAELQGAEPDFPEDSMDEINEMINELTKNSKSLPDEMQTKYYTNAQSLLGNMKSAIQGVTQDAQSQAASTADTGSASKDIAPALNYVNAFAQKLAKGESFTTQELNNFANALLDLRTARGKVGDGSGAAASIDNLFNAMAENFKTKDGGNALAKLLAQSYTSQGLADYVEEDTGGKGNKPTPEETATALETAASNFQSASTGIPFLEDTGSQMSKIAEGLVHEPKTLKTYSHLDNMVKSFQSEIKEIPQSNLQDFGSTVDKVVQEGVAAYTGRADAQDAQGANLDALNSIVNGIDANFNNIAAQGGNAPLDPTVYGAVNESIGQEVQGLGQLADHLIAWGPSPDRSYTPVSADDVAKAQDIKNQLAQIQSRLPNPTMDDIAALPQMLKDMNAIATKMGSGKGAGGYWNIAAQLFKAINTTVTQKLQEASDNLTKANSLVQASQNIKSISDQFPSLIEKFLAPNPSPEDIGNLSSQVVTLLSLRYDETTPPQLQQAIDVLLAKFTGQGNEKLYSLISEGIIANSLLGAQGDSPDAVVSDAQSKVTEIINGLSDKTGPLAKGLTAALTPALSDMQQNGKFYFSLSTGSVTLSDKFNALIQEDYDDVDMSSLNLSDIELANQGIGQVINSFQQQANQAQESADKTKSTLEELNNQAGIDAAVSKEKAKDTSSLPDLFYDLVMNPTDGFMARENAKLQEQATDLSYNNEGAKIMNDLLAPIVDFSQAGTNFDLKTRLPQDANDKNVYSADLSDVQEYLKDEVSQTDLDIKNNNEVLSKIQSKRAEIKQEVASGKMTQDQADKLLSQLDQVEANTNVSIKQLSDLKDLLVQLKPQAKGPNQVTVDGPPGWYAKVQGLESKVVEGDHNRTPSGGLDKIQTLISGFQTTYANQGQQSQMKLQLLMTQIQQEWTIVSTCLSMLHQMYMTIAQNINK